MGDVHAVFASAEQAIHAEARRFDEYLVELLRAAAGEALLVYARCRHMCRCVEALCSAVVADVACWPTNDETTNNALVLFFNALHALQGELVRADRAGDAAEVYWRGKTLGLLVWSFTVDWAIYAADEAIVEQSMPPICTLVVNLVPVCDKLGAYVGPLPALEALSRSLACGDGRHSALVGAALDAARAAARSLARGPQHVARMLIEVIQDVILVSVDDSAVHVEIVDDSAVSVELVDDSAAYGAPLEAFAQS